MRHNIFRLSLDLGRWRRPLSTLAIKGTTTTLRLLRRRCAPNILCRRQSSISPSASEINEEETVEAVFVFHRHGDRTPGKPLVEETFVEEESAFWRTKIPPFSYHKVLCEQFPVKRGKDDDKSGDSSSNNSTSFQDTAGGNESYGFLTWKGMHQMYHNGVFMAHRYGPQTAISSTSTKTSSAISAFRDCWDIRAVSTNYLRTVMSCQAFLDGLLTKNNNTGQSDNEAPLHYDYPTYYESSRPDEHRSKGTANHNDVVEIVVRDPEQHETIALNAFDTSPKLMKKLVGDVFATPEFIATDRQARSLASELSKFYLPGLSKHSSYAASPSGGISVNWVGLLLIAFAFAFYREREKEFLCACYVVFSNQPKPTHASNDRSTHSSLHHDIQIHAADHFVCRSSHSVPVTMFCPHLLGGDRDDIDIDIEHKFESLKEATLSHLQTRFHGYYSNPSLLGEMAGPALNEVALVMNKVVSEHAATPTPAVMMTKTKKPFRIYSCHDVTILALLYAMRDRYLVEAEPPSWPTYATCLTLELVRLENDTTKKASASFVVRAWLNEAPIPAFSPSPVAIMAARGAEPAFSIELSKFEKIIREVNAARAPNEV